MATTSASSFSKMGEEPLTDHLVNASGNRSPYTMNAPKHGPSADSEPGTQAVRGVGSMATGEHSGPTFAPQTTLSWPNDPSASKTGRGMRMIPSVASKTGNGDFWAARAENNGGQVI